MDIPVTVNPPSAVNPRSRRIELRKVLAQQLSSQQRVQIPLVYRDRHCKTRNQYVHEYADGRRLLILQNRRSLYEQVLKQLI